MQIDPANQSKADNYKLLTNVVVPRPIAWVTSMSKAGVLNLAPYSFFNAVGADPIYLIISVGKRDNGTLKDTAANIQATGEFVVNMVTEELIDAMNISAADFPPEQSEINAAQLEVAPSLRLKVPRLLNAQVSLECKLFEAKPLGANTLIIGEVVMFHIADQLVGDRLHINNFAPVGRLGSPSMYSRTTDRFDLPRMTYEQLKISRK